MQVKCHFGSVCAAEEISVNIGLHSGLKALRSLNGSSLALCLGTRDAIELVASKRPIFVCISGGRNSSSALKSLRAFGVLDGSWQNLPSMQKARLGAVAGVLAGCLYICGGGSAISQTDRRTVECFKPQTLSWTMASPMLVPRAHSGGAVVNETLLVCGGCGSVTRNSEASVEYIGPMPDFDVWRMAPPLPEGRSHHSAAKLRDDLFVCGGLDDGGEVQGSVFSLRLVGVPGEYSWCRAAPMLTARMSAAAAATSRVLVLCGGLSQSDEVLSSVECYDASAQCWSALPSMSTPRSGAAIASAGKRIFIFGGRRDHGLGGGRRGGIALLTAEALSLHNAEEHAWVPLPSLPHGVEQACAAVLSPS